jgi:hypothetical protein
LSRLSTHSTQQYGGCKGRIVLNLNQVGLLVRKLHLIPERAVMQVSAFIRVDVHSSTL